MTPRTVTNPLRAAGILAIILAFLACTALTATAAEDDSDDAAEDEGGYIEEVIVTASKREVNLQDSSLAITAYTGEQLDSRGIREVTDIAAAIPGIDMAESVPTESILIIRSMSNNGRGYHRAEVWRQQTNSSYLDDVVLFPGITPMKMVDLERMEVLKGPQGTLFGKSAMAGLVRFVSNKPNPEAFSGNLTASYDTVAGGGNGNSLEGYVNVPLSDSFAVRLTGYRYDLPGFIDVVGVRPQNDADTENTAGYRLRARWDVGDSMFLEASLINQTTEVGDVGKPMATWEPSQETDIHAIQLTAFDPEDPKRQWREPGDTEEDVRSLKFEADLGEFTLSLIGANMTNHSFFYRNALWECVPDGGCPGMTIGGLTSNGYAYWHSSEGPSERKIETFEIRAISNVEDGDFLEWIAGAWYENNNHRRAGRSWWDTNDVDYIASLSGGWGGFRGCAAYTAQEIADGTIIGDRFQYNNQDELAAYTELGLNVTDQLKLTLGYRHSKLRTNFYRGEKLDRCRNTDNINQNAESGHTSDWANVGTYRVNADYHFTDDVMLFAFAATGYRPGGTNAIQACPRGETSCPGSVRNETRHRIPYESDSVWNYEAGVRSTWQDGRLLLNGSMYRIDWTDMQSPVFRASERLGLYRIRGRVIVNIGESRISGIEAMAVYAVNDELNLTLNMGYKIAEILSDQREEYVGLPLPGSSSGTGAQISLLADWRKSMPIGDVRVNATARYAPRRYGHFSKENPVPSYMTADLSVGVRRDALEVWVNIDNLFDERALTNQSPGYPGWPRRDGIDWREQYSVFTMIRPRSIGFGVSYDLGQ